MNTKSKVTAKENQPRISAAALMRLSGVSAMLAGLSFIVIGLFHPVNELAYVTTTTWVIVHIFASSLGFFGMLGLAGIYTRQVEKAGWLGLIGFLLFSGWMALVGFFSFIEAAVLPLLATQYPQFVVSVMGMFSSVPGQVDLGALPTLWNISGPMFIVGPLVFAIATFRAAILPRWAAGLLALGSLMIPVGAMVPLELQAKIIMVPIGLGVAWMGYALLTERREKSAQALHDQKTSMPEATKAA